jgi:FtsH-binding integral membrane protein
MVFMLIEVFLFKSGLAPVIARGMLGVSWLLVLGGFVVVSWLATRVAHTALSKPANAAYVGFVVAESIIFLPLLYIADYKAPGTITSAAVVTFLGFAGLTAVVFVTGKDFSFSVACSFGAA